MHPPVSSREGRLVSSTNLRRASGAFAAIVAAFLAMGPASAHAGERASTGAMFRWWWPGAAVDDGELVRELDAIADAGYKGVEIADVMDSVDYAVDPDVYGYG